MEWPRRSQPIHADSNFELNVELTPSPVHRRKVPGTNRRVSGTQCFSTGRIITNAKRQVIAQKVHSGASPNID